MAKTTPSTPSPAPAQPSTPNRRKFFRRSKPFQGVYYASPGERVPVVGLDISGGGLCILLQQPVKDPSAELTIGAVIADKPFTIVGTIRWSDTVKMKAGDAYRYGLKLKAIADEDWDRLMMWTVESNPEFVEGATLSAAQRDALITSETQGAIAAELLTRERVDPFANGRLPLIEYNFVKYTMRQGVPYAWLKVRSRCIDKTLRTPTDHLTNVLVSCDDGHMKIIEA